MSVQKITKLEKDIKGKMSAIKTKQMTPKESNIGKLFNRLKVLDEVSYDTLLSEYKTVLAAAKA